MVRTIARTFGEQLLEVVDLYLEQGGTHPIDLEKLARFAISGGHWEWHENARLKLCKRDFSRALCEQYHRDPQGRDVRTYHAVKQSSGGVQQVFWADMRDATPEHMQLAFQQRRTQIVGDCVQLKRDVDSYNDKNGEGALVQMEFDFAEDIREREQPGDDYRPNQPR